MTALTTFLARIVKKSGVPQAELARRTGFTQKHISQMLTLGEGSTNGWDALLCAAGIELLDDTDDPL